MADLSPQQLLARLDAQAAELAAQRAAIARLHPRDARPRRRRPQRLLARAAVALLVALTPLALLAADPFFSDLNLAAAVHRTDIQAIGNVGITTGFEDPNDPTARLYAPKGVVTREEMASFLARTAGLGANPPVVNAKTAQTAASAGNAATVGGYAPSGLLRVADASAFKSAADLIPGPNNPGELDLAQVAITAPGPGFVLVIGTVGLFTASANACPCRVEARLIDRTPGSTLQSFGFAGLLPNNPPNGSGGYVTLANTSVFPVAGPGARTYALAVERLNGTAAVGAEGNISVLFVPFGPTGGPPPAP